jgi:hypothetical protein
MEVAMRMVGLLIGALLLVAASPALGARDAVKDANGKPLAVVVDCNSCKAGGEKCFGGVDEGFNEGSRCGQCLIKANFGKSIFLPSDLMILGKLKDENGNPVTGKFVRIFLPNTWTVRTRTTDQGTFILRLGPSGKRESKKPLSLDLGERRMNKDSKTGTYALFLLPEEYKSCPAEAEPAKKP